MNVMIVTSDIINANLGKINTNLKRYTIPYPFFYINTLDNQMVILDFVSIDFNITGTIINMDDSNFSTPLIAIK